MYKIAAMGDKDSIYGFSSIGFDIFTEDKMDDPGAILRNLADNNYGVIFITESLAQQLENEINRYKDRQLPVIVPIPGITNNTGLGLSMISQAVEKAVGFDILANT